jgi:hypothetical protein
MLVPQSASPSQALSRCLALLCLAATLGCTTPLNDAPDKLRKSSWNAGPLYSASESEDGSSWSWSTMFWLIGADAEGQRNTQRALPFWWHAEDTPYAETTMVFPLYFSRVTAVETTRWFTPLYGYTESDDQRSDRILLDVWDWTRAQAGPRSRSGLFLVYDHEQYDEMRHNFTLLPLLGLAHLAHWEWGFPAAGVRAAELGRSASRRFDLIDVLGMVQVFGYDDVGDRREIRALTLFSNEVMSIFRSWRGRRDDDPFVREWLFPLYMNVQDVDSGWKYIGPLWGRIDDHTTNTSTDWWLLGLLSRTSSAAGNTWRVLGLPVISP